MLKNLSGEAAVLMIPWHVTDLTEDETYEVSMEWDRIKYPFGYDPLVIAFTLAKQKLLSPAVCKNG